MYGLQMVWTQNAQARKVLLADRKEKLKEVERQRERNAKLRETPARSKAVTIKDL